MPFLRFFQVRVETGAGSKEREAGIRKDIGNQKYKAIFPLLFFMPFRKQWNCIGF